MTWLFLVIAVAGLAIGGMAGALAVRGRNDRNARLEIVPGVPSGAPESWAGAHTPEARLHRRIGDAVRSLRAQPTLSAPTFVDQRAALEQEALRIDARLIAVAALTGPRREQGIADVAALVERFEGAIADLVTASLDDQSSLEAVISESEIRLRALEAARAEIEQLDEQPPS